MDKNKQAALAMALKQIGEIKQVEKSDGNPFRPEYRTSNIERLGYYSMRDYVPYVGAK